MADTRQVTFNVSIKVYDNLASLASKASMAKGAYAKLLFEAAYSARCKPTGDIELDAAVARSVLLWGSRQFDTAQIAATVGLSEPTVQRIVEAWASEIKGAAQ